MGALIVATAGMMILVAIGMAAQGAGPRDVGGGAGNVVAGLPRVMLA